MNSRARRRAIKMAGPLLTKLTDLIGRIPSAIHGEFWRIVPDELPAPPATEGSDG